jgi:hypothetical protein
MVYHFPGKCFFDVLEDYPGLNLIVFQIEKHVYNHTHHSTVCIFMYEHGGTNKNVTTSYSTFLNIFSRRA